VISHVHTGCILAHGGRRREAEDGVKGFPGIKR
jgi:hypothetical protein